MSAPFEYVFPTIRGLQAGKAYYISMCPLKLIPRIFLFDDEDLEPEVRAQRTLNAARIPEIASYIVQNRDSYVFSAITCSIDADVRFVALSDDPGARDIGRLHVPMTARFLINDSQHRRAAIELALKEARELGDESIAVVFFLDPALRRCQQMFSDLNRYAVRPSPSLNILYDHRDERSALARELVNQTTLFKGTVELEKSALAPKSSKLFTLSAITSATRALLADMTQRPFAEQVQVAKEFWDAVGEHMPDWQRVRAKQAHAGELRKSSIAAHGLVLSALGHVGRALLAEEPEAWRARLPPLAEIDWSRERNLKWEGRATISGRVSKASAQILLTAAVIKQQLGLALSPEEVSLERRLGRGEVIS